MHRLASFFHIPQEIFAWVGGVVAASVALLGTAIQAVVPPDVTNEWPVYGVLISAVIVLFISNAGIIRWVATKFLSQQEANTAAMNKISETMSKVAEASEKQNKWFEEFGKNALQMHLDHARMSVHAHMEHEQQERKPRRRE